MSALLLSYMYLFIDEKSAHVGAGDLATGPYVTGISYRPRGTLLTNMFNNMVNGTLPPSILEYPQFFILPRNVLKSMSRRGEMRLNKNKINSINIPDESIRNYHYLWLAYNNKMGNLTIFCSEERNINCSNPKSQIDKYYLAESIEQHLVADGIRNKNLPGKIIEGEALSPPCRNLETIKQFNINPICDFIQNISDNKEAFLKLMKFTKQSPVYQEDDEEYKSIYKREELAEFGFYLIDKKKVVKYTN